MPSRVNFTCESIRSGARIKLLARYPTHQSMISDSVGFDFKQELVSMDVGAACKTRPPTATVPGAPALHSMQFFAVDCKDAAVLGCPIAASHARTWKPLAAPGGDGLPNVHPLIVTFIAEGNDI